MTTIPPVTVRCPDCRNVITVPVNVESTHTVGNTIMVTLAVAEYDHDCPAT
jgi:hypothetical protein